MLQHFVEEIFQFDFFFVLSMNYITLCIRSSCWISVIYVLNEQNSFNIDIYDMCVKSKHEHTIVFTHRLFVGKQFYSLLSDASLIQPSHQQSSESKRIKFWYSNGFTILQSYESPPMMFEFIYISSNKLMQLWIECCIEGRTIVCCKNGNM